MFTVCGTYTMKDMFGYIIVVVVNCLMQIKECHSFTFNDKRNPYIYLYGWFIKTSVKCFVSEIFFVYLHNCFCKLF